MKTDLKKIWRVFNLQPKFRWRHWIMLYVCFYDIFNQLKRSDSGLIVELKQSETRKLRLHLNKNVLSPSVLWNVRITFWKGKKRIIIIRRRSFINYFENKWRSCACGNQNKKIKFNNQRMKKTKMSTSAAVCRSKNGERKKRLMSHEDLAPANVWVSVNTAAV